MHHQKGFISFLLIFIVILTAVGGLFYYGVKNGSFLKTSDPNLDTTQKFDEQMDQNSSIPTTSETGLNIFTDEKMGFTFEYPAYYKITNLGDNSGKSALNISVEDPENQNINYSFEKDSDYNEYFSISITVYPSVQTSNMDTYIATPICESKKQYTEAAGKPFNVNTCKKDTKGSFKSYRTGDINGLTSTIGFFESGSDYYVFTMEPYFIKVVQFGPEGTLVGKNPKQTLNEIISTFRFNK